MASAEKKPANAQRDRDQRLQQLEDIAAGIVQGHPEEAETKMPEKPYSVVPLGPRSAIVSCPHCGYYVSTEMNIIPSGKTHLKAMVLCLCCLCFVPYICPICMNVDHFCPECENFIGTYIS